MKTHIKSISISEIREIYSPGIGRHFFDRDTMRFFRSKLPKTGVTGAGGTYFISSEQFDAHSRRKYTVRQLIGPGSIKTVGEFQQFPTASQARTAAGHLAAGNGEK